MIFYRSTADIPAPGAALLRVRLLTLVALIGYPLGAVIRLASGGALALELTGLAIVGVALVATLLVIGSSLQRIVAEQPDRLDEFELALRQRALSRSYSVVCGAVLLALIYAALAADFGGWLPAGYDQWSAIFWGFFVWASLLPTAFLAWTLVPLDSES